MVPVDKVKVINSRLRDEQQFQMNVQSIDAVGLLKPILVNDKFIRNSGLYELVCGEGRLIAHKRLGADEIKAEVMTCSRKEAYLLSLIENLARSQADVVEGSRRQRAPMARPRGQGDQHGTPEDRKPPPS
jgi:ParB family chromosome partitioning protein